MALFNVVVLVTMTNKNILFYSILVCPCLDRLGFKKDRLDPLRLMTFLCPQKKLASC